VPYEYTPLFAEPDEPEIGGRKRDKRKAKAARKARRKQRR
jgi:hypothetical protein